MTSVALRTSLAGFSCCSCVPRKRARRSGAWRVRPTPCRQTPTPCPQTPLMKRSQSPGPQNRLLMERTARPGTTRARSRRPRTTTSPPQMTATATILGREARFPSGTGWALRRTKKPGPSKTTPAARIRGRKARFPSGTGWALHRTKKRQATPDAPGPSKITPAARIRGRQARFPSGTSWASRRTAKWKTTPTTMNSPSTSTAATRFRLQVGCYFRPAHSPSQLGEFRGD
mmetsp:Transcript_29670/g.63060  ORF Transcript_29670/g.63060 Transcript_29670/m.63060 type:complete len:230 (+) Transcript_29670:167-856(+)